MGNYNDMLEAAYAVSRRQGDMRRNREREQSPYEDRRNRYTESDIRSGWSGPESKRPSGQAMDTYRPADNNYRDVLNKNYSGKGPRNYRRSDDRIQELVCDRLFENAELDASDIEVSVKDSEVILTGAVAQKQDKRLAEDLAESVRGVVNVENRIRVNRRQMA